MYLPDDFSSSGGANCDSKDPHAVVLLLDEAVEEAITPEIDKANLCLPLFLLGDTTANPVSYTHLTLPTIE